MKRLRRREKIILIFLILAILLLNYDYLDSSTSNFFSTDKTFLVTRIIDGDTLAAGNETVRLLGINTPERGELYYNEAKDFLSQEVLGKNVTLRFGREGVDKYGRTLAYVYLNNENINQKIIENGFANYYFPSGKDRYYAEFVGAWNMCIVNNGNLCRSSNNSCSKCITLKDSSTLINNCATSCNLTNWRIKGEGRADILFNTTLARESQLKFQLGIKEDNTIFLYDSDGGLVLWKSFWN